MNLTLLRKDFLETGIFGELNPDDESFTLKTLEHAYIQETQSPYFIPKIPVGVYRCVRGMHQLEGMAEVFETFEITNVPGHTNLLFHTGNKNGDSAGCVLVGLFRSGNDSIMQSRTAFQILMEAQVGINEFSLSIVEEPKIA